MNLKRVLKYSICIYIFFRASQVALVVKTLPTFTHWRRQWQPTPAFLPGESQGRGSLVGCHLWGCTESDMTEVTQHTRKIGEDFANQRVVHS